MTAEFHEIKIGHEFYVFRSEADAMAAAGAMMRGGHTVSLGRGATLEPINVEVGRKTLTVTRANIQRVLGVR